jgi:hypothetical protein
MATKSYASDVKEGFAKGKLIDKKEAALKFLNTLVPGAFTIDSESEAEDDIDLEFVELTRTISRQQASSSKVEQKVDELKGKVKKLKAKLETARFVRIRDKIAFFIGLNMLVFGFLVLGRAPEYFHHLFACGFLLLMIIRYVAYKAKNWHYFLLEFCYFVNSLTILTV